MREYKPGYTWLNPDFNDTLYPDLEKRLGRKLTFQENERWFHTSGMRKEWMHNSLKVCETVEQVEALFTRGQLPTSKFFGWDKIPERPKSFWSVLWEKLKRKL